MVVKRGETLLIRGPSFYRNNITIIAEDAFGKIVGVIAAIGWDNGQFEICSHVIHPDYRGSQLGEILFWKMVARLRRKPEKVFLFSKSPEYYEKLGLVRTDPASFSAKIRADCKNCPRGPNGPGFAPCPEVAMELPDSYWKRKKGGCRC
ncbi:MAG: GNAT family N-acetyltransferase [Patescibacteria group bacterium]|nr:GNAT family N-acetyltransferase [Patescibacteria group bacterium]MDD4611164.1 GNAT family N-acetyltransferase [Patescibacteria group bacterium]